MIPAYTKVGVGVVCDGIPFSLQCAPQSSVACTKTSGNSLDDATLSKHFSFLG